MEKLPEEYCITHSGGDGQGRKVRKVIDGESMGGTLPAHSKHQATSTASPSGL